MAKTEICPVPRSARPLAPPPQPVASLQLGVRCLAGVLEVPVAQLIQVGTEHQCEGVKHSLEHAAGGIDDPHAFTRLLAALRYVDGEYRGEPFAA